MIIVMRENNNHRMCNHPERAWNWLATYVITKVTTSVLVEVFEAFMEGHLLSRDKQKKTGIEFLISLKTSIACVMESFVEPNP